MPMPAASAISPHDRRAPDRLLVAGDRHVGVERLGAFHELGRGARVQALAVADRHARAQLFSVCHVRLPPQASPDSSWLAMLMYLRPASLAAVMASRSVAWSRTLASLISIGRLMPGEHLGAGLLHHGDGQVRGRAAEHVGEQDTPWPLSTRRTASISSSRRTSTSSSGPMANGLELLLRSDHVLQGGAEFLGKATMGDDDDAESCQFAGPLRRRSGRRFSPWSAAQPRRHIMVTSGVRGRGMRRLGNHFRQLRLVCATARASLIAAELSNGV